MNKISFLFLFSWILFHLGCQNLTDRPPNILFVIADDQSFPHAGIYGTTWIKTPGFDRVAQEGLLFTNAFTTNAKCSPSRATVLTGRDSWLLEEATNHVPFFPEKLITFPEVLLENGYKTGFTGKGWAPGVARKNGQPRALIGKAYSEKKLSPPASFISNVDYAENFKVFLDEKAENQPFFFWVGGHEPHRAYEYGAGVQKGGKDTQEIEDIPDFWPKSDVIRNDMLDYAFEIEHFDRHLVEIILELEKRKLLENTIIVVTSDNGMPFPRVKGQVYPFDHRLPLAIRWGRGIKNPGRVIQDYFSFSDFAPTFLDLAGIASNQHPMAAFSGISWRAVFNELSHPKKRNFMVIGKERHDIGRENDQGYPVRAIVAGQYFYSRNFKPQRWPAGNPETGYLNTDGSPTKTEILELNRNDVDTIYWHYAFGKRPEEELYDIQNDPYCLNNLSSIAKYDELKKALEKKMMDQLTEQGDPRVLGKGDLFDQYPYSGENVRDFYHRYKRGENIKTPWVNPSDFEK